MVKSERVFTLKESPSFSGAVLYWMSRDQRVDDNWALIYAAMEANRLNAPLHVAFCLVNNFLGANLRHYSFMIDGLKEVHSKLSERGIGFHLLIGDPTVEIPYFIKEIGASLLVSDFDPLRIKRKWKDDVSNTISISHKEVDAHNIVPCRFVSSKPEFGAYTIRPKIHRLLPRFFEEIPEVPEIKNKVSAMPINWNVPITTLDIDSSVKPIKWLNGGFTKGMTQLESFISKGLNGYAEKRNDPLANGQSNLSPFLHFGHVSAHRVAIEASKANAPKPDKDAFLEELIVRRELSDNFCFYNSDYDNFSGFHSWAKLTLNEHRADEREYIYTMDEFEQAETHDPLWNAAQLELVVSGKMHGYLRMYWAKKILEWTKTPEEAQKTAIYLNDKYSIDGRDPNGYAGIAWSIGGVHDRAWSNGPVFGKIRYMNFNGCKRKFSVDGYIDMIKKMIHNE